MIGGFTSTRRHFLGMAGITSAGLCLGVFPKLSFAADAPITETRVMMGTFVGITLADVSKTQASEIFEQAFYAARQTEQIFNRHDSATPLAELNKSGRLNDAPSALLELITRSQRMTALTDGAFDMTVQPVVDLLRSKQNPHGILALDAGEMRAAQELVHIQGVRVNNKNIDFDRQGMGITLDGIAKGAVADVISTTLHALGVHNHLINAGGDILASGTKAPNTPWRVAVESPEAKEHLSVLSLATDAQSQAIATSGGYRTHYDATGQHHHLIAPQTGKSATHVVSASVLAPTTLEADALATALAVMPAQEGLKLIRKLPNCEALLLTASGRLLQSFV